MKRFNPGDEVVKAKRWSSLSYNRFGGDEFDVPIGTKGIIDLYSFDGSVYVIFENGKHWNVDEDELVLFSDYKVSKAKKHRRGRGRVKHAPMIVDLAQLDKKKSNGDEY